MSKPSTVEPRTNHKVAIPEELDISPYTAAAEAPAPPPEHEAHAGDAAAGAEPSPEEAPTAPAGALPRAATARELKPPPSDRLERNGPCKGPCQRRGSIHVMTQSPHLTYVSAAAPPLIPVARPHFLSGYPHVCALCTCTQMSRLASQTSNSVLARCAEPHGRSCGSGLEQGAT